MLQIRTHLCLKYFIETSYLQGDIIELGVGGGTTTFPLAVIGKYYGKKIYACDTFEGMPYDDSINFPNKVKKGEINKSKEFFSNYSEDKFPNIAIVKGLVEDTLPKTLNDNTFCFAWVDLDLYQPTSFCYKFLENRMIIGGIIGFHDYGFHRCPGIKIVVDNEVNTQKYKQLVKKDTCVFFKRTR